MSPRVAQAAPAPDETAEDKGVTITYALISCQGNINWSRRPALVRMVPDSNDANKRRPLDSLPQDNREQELKKPVQNVIVFAHGRNEAEKGGDAALDFGDVQAPIRTTEPSAEYAYDPKEEARYLVKVKMFDQADTRVVIATAGATVSGSVAQPKYLQSEDTWVLRVAVGALHHAYVDYVFRFAVDD